MQTQFHVLPPVEVAGNEAFHCVWVTFKGPSLRAETTESEVTLSRYEASKGLEIKQRNTQTESRGEGWEMGVLSDSWDIALQPGELQGISTEGLEHIAWFTLNFR